MPWPPDGDAGAAMRALPDGRGVFAFDNADGATLTLAVSADVRRLVRSRLLRSCDGRDDAAAAAGDDAMIAVRRISAMRAGSEFEADWAYLQLARTRLPLEYQLLLDRWQCFWLHVDPDAAHPRWVKTAHPGRPPTGECGAYIGPFADKHAAGRFIELLEDGFDLCRYHHILVQSPHATACAYAEMGRCPAPCDGSISMDQYRRQIIASIEFADAGRGASRDELERRMRHASGAQDFETASQLKAQLDRTAAMNAPPYRFVRGIDHLRLLAVMPSPRVGWRRLFVIIGGWIAPLCDVRDDAADADYRLCIDAARRHSAERAVSFDESTVENLGLLAAHLFLPAKRAEGVFLRIDDELDVRTLRRAVRRRAVEVAVRDDQVMESGSTS